jgi:hypothetical protein
MTGQSRIVDRREEDRQQAVEEDSQQAVEEDSRQAGGG